MIECAEPAQGYNQDVPEFMEITIIIRYNASNIKRIIMNKRQLGNPATGFRKKRKQAHPRIFTNQHEWQINKESRAVRENSMRILREFERIAE